MEHPVVKRAAREIPLRATFLQRRPWNVILYIVFGLFLIGSVYSIGVWFVLILIGSVALGVIFVALLEIPLHGTSIGGNWANLISTTIANEQQAGLIELLSLTPGGILGACLLICGGCASQRNGLRWFRRRIFYFPLIGAALALLLNLWRWALLETTAEAIVVNVLVVMIALHIHYLQASMMGCLVGMLTPTFDFQPTYARMSASALFLMLTVMLYGSTLYLSLIILPVVVATLGLTYSVAEIALSFLRVIILIILHEAVNSILWRLLLARIEARPTTVLNLF
jgi:hypothetical protein